jgi:hypothetical protein
MIPGASPGAAGAPLFDSMIVSDERGAASKTRASRVNRELRTLLRDLPLHIGSTVALRVDAARPFALRAASRARLARRTTAASSFL